MEASRREDEAPREDTVPDVSGPRSVASEKRLDIGDVVAEKYVIERKLGVGGMGQVFAAKHAKLGTTVAIKVMHRELAAEPQAVARFLQEAHAMARLKSEHAVRVHDIGELAGGVPYLIMDYLEGRDLSALLVERGPLPVLLALHYARQACDALIEAHDAGIIHRDVKPQNLFLVKKASGAESLRVLDFGLAKAVSSLAGGDHALTRTGHIIGSPHYMAPEQITSGGVVDVRTDVWALGATLFRLLTREYPYQESNPAAAAAAILTRDPARIKSLRPDVPDAAAAVVDRCLSRDQAHRFQTVRELAMAIDQARFIVATPSQSFVPVSLPMPPPPVSRAFAPRQSPPPSNAPLYVSIALLALLLLGVGVASIVLLKKRPAYIVPTAIAAPTK